MLDYFGQTVNVAARLQGEAKAGELVMPAAIAEQAASRGLFDATRITQRYAASLKGVDGLLEVARVCLAHAPA